MSFRFCTKNVQSSAMHGATQSLQDGHAATPSPTKISQHATPATQVLATPELLEMILLFVCSDDPTTAFLSRRVNMFFRATIEGSVHLQRALFLRCEPQPPELEDETGLRINPIFDSTGIIDARRYIEVYDFGLRQEPWAPIYDLGGQPVYAESVDVWCEDAILNLRDGPLFDMVLLQRHMGDQFRVCLEFYFRLRKDDPELPEAVRVPVKFGGWQQITIGEVIKKVRNKLGEWYPEHYDGESVMEGGVNAHGSGNNLRWDAVSCDVETSKQISLDPVRWL